jgi:hypothetical protein
MIAIYPYTAQNRDELTFVKDDVIRIISKDEPDWWRGELGSTTGLFPVNYVQPLPPQAESPSKPKVNSLYSSPSSTRVFTYTYVCTYAYIPN